MAVELKWGSYTWIPVLGMSGAIGTAILLLSWHWMGPHWHEHWYVPLLGYYVVLSICQDHFFEPEWGPSLKGLSRQWVSISGAVLLYHVNGFIMNGIVGIPGSLLMPGHFIFIVLGFFFFGWDDIFFNGALTKWIPIDALKAFFWYGVIWVLWYVLFAMPGGLSSALTDFHATRYFWFLASFQWVIMMELMTAINWKDFIDEIDFPNDYVRGGSLMAFALVAGFSIATFCHFIVATVVPMTPMSPTPAQQWHHVLYMGTYPLIPIIIFGLYTNHLNSIADVKKRVGARTGALMSMVVVQYLIFRFIIAPSHIFGDHPWYHHFDLVFNFTISIIALTHHWFSKRWGFIEITDD